MCESRGVPNGAAHLRELRAAPMTSCQWCGRMVRNLRKIHASANDTVRLLGAAERQLLLNLAEPISDAAERSRCLLEVLRCLAELRWDERRPEARELVGRAARPV